jgi:hypothetical protein
MRLPQSTNQPLSFRLFSITLFVALAVIVPLPARAAAQPLLCSPSSLGFGSVTAGGSESQLVVLTNTGQTDLTLSTLSVTGSEFSVSGVTLPVDLAAGGSISLSVTFAPTADGRTAGTVTFSSIGNPNLQLQVAGSGVASEALVASPSSLSFGQVAVGGNTTLSVVLTNAGYKKGTMKSLQMLGSGFSVSGPSFPIALVPGQSVALNVSFSPQSAGVSSGRIFISGPNLNIPLSGTGTTIGQLVISPAALNFGNVTVGTTTTQPSTMTATGGSVTVSSANSGNAQFSIAGIALPMTISGGQSVVFDVVFAPSNNGTSSSALTFASTSSSSQGMSVTGTGVMPQHSVNLSWNASTSSVAGYNIYRGIAPGRYSKINSTLDSNTAYTDNTVVAGTTYYYAATAVNSSGVESGYSTPVQIVVPLS